MGIGLYIHEARQVWGLVEFSWTECTLQSPTPHIHVYAAGCRNLHSVHSIQLNSV